MFSSFQTVERPASASMTSRHAIGAANNNAPWRATRLFGGTPSINNNFGLALSFAGLPDRAFGFRRKS